MSDMTLLPTGGGFGGDGAAVAVGANAVLVMAESEKGA